MYQFNDDQILLKNFIQRFVKQSIEPGSMERDMQGKYPKEIMDELKGLGYYGIMIPEEEAGLGMDTVSSMIILSEIARSDAAIAHMLDTANFGYLIPVNTFATEEQKDQYVLPCITHFKRGILAVNESKNDDGNEVTARKEGDYYIINGSKTMITDAHIADFALTLVKTGESSEGMGGMSAFIIPVKNQKGVIIGSSESTMGMKSLKMSEIHFEECKVHKSQLIGTENFGFMVIGKSIEMMNISNAAVALGIAERAFDEALNYTKVRKIDGILMSQIGAIRSEIAEMKARLEQMRLDVFYTAYLMDLKVVNTMSYLAITKYKVTENAKWMCDKALQLFGGYGYTKGYVVEKLYRDVRAFTILGCPSEQQKDVIVGDVYGEYN